MHKLSGMFRPADLFDLGHTAHAALFDGCTHAWEALPRIESYLQERLQPACRGRVVGRAVIGERVFIGEGTVIEDGVVIQGPAIIGCNCEIRHNAYLRANVIIGDRCVIGNATEVKNAVLFDEAVAPHFNYVGDSILGFRAHLGAGAILSNFKSLPGNVTVEFDGVRYDTGLRKFGALVGDGAEIGCNAVLNPGSVIGRGSVVYPGVCWRGVLPPNRIVKNRAAFEIVERR
ncbi:MAG: UDP-N-acetylglucosamine diphosphorylase [Verrucomicrobiae bacterium]|nr:UDP-N-acetylglucosamine diphosphorylase [Verrucomicrobiae bacterium]MDW8308383.1 UDP-N-acetylglucosamine diphosphorylase [Verrucomicrobiales bacterium]